MTVYDQTPWLKFYESRLSPEVKAVDETYVDLLERGLKFRPEIAAFHFLGIKITYKELDRLSMRFASYIRKQGCNPGDVVGIDLPNIPQYVIALAGALRAGCVVTGISPLLVPKEMAYQLNDSGAKALVTLDAIYENRVQKIKDDIPKVTCIITTNIADYLPLYKRILGKLTKKVPSGKVETIKGKEVSSFKAALSNTLPDIPKASIKPDDTCFIQYTGGTTGMPKGAELTHRNMVSNLAQGRQWLDLSMAGGTVCSGFPYFHMAGLYFGMTCMSLAFTQCLIPDPRNTKNICKEIAAHRPMMMLMVPSLYQMLIDDPAFSMIDFSSCKACISGASPFSKEAINALEAIVGKGKVVELYGMTEASPIITMNPLNGKKKIGSVGIPLQSTQIKLVDVESGTREVAMGEVGEIIVHGPQVMKGYHNKPEETTNTLREFQGAKWLYTGDVASMDADGYFSIADRTKDMLIVSGYKVFSREVEEVLSEHKAVELCAIIGIKNPERPDSQIVKAVIQLSKDAQAKGQEEVKKEILEHCKENLAPYKIPKVIVFTDSLPLTAVGKVDKKVLRKM
ncbi:MAG: AMP-binding protein [Dehalococcoidia bacterium]|jgi:acyl-CoA synthetase (AMP-forming)/AMP-acid ligase II